MTKKTMNQTKRVLISLLTLTLFLLAPAAQESRTLRSNNQARVLFIGNSYTYFNNLPELFSQLAASATASKAITAQMVVRGGATLQRHWEEGGALTVLQQSRWDYVVLQEQSTLPITEPATMHKYARLFDAEIKKTGAKTIFFLTWARQNQSENQARLNDAYFAIAKELQARIAPVGIAWAKAFKQDSKLVLHNEDKSHPNAVGSYLAACVLYAAIFKKSPENLNGKLSGHPVKDDGSISDERVELINLNQTDAKLIQRIAWQTVKNLKT
jgi:hypothetical protein